MPQKQIFKITLPDALKNDPVANMHVEAVAAAIVKARNAGFIIEAVMQPDTPLAQGHYFPHVVLREEKKAGLAREERLNKWTAIYDAGEKAAADGRITILPKDFE